MRMRVKFRYIIKDGSHCVRDAKSPVYDNLETRLPCQQPLCSKRRGGERTGTLAKFMIVLFSIKLCVNCIFHSVKFLLVIIFRGLNFLPKFHFQDLSDVHIVL